MIGKNKNTCLSKHDLNVLIEEQKRDSDTCLIIPEYIIPRQSEPFARIEDRKKRLVFIAHLAKFSLREIGNIFHVSHTTIRFWILECYEVYPNPLTYLQRS